VRLVDLEDFLSNIEALVAKTTEEQSRDDDDDDVGVDYTVNDPPYDARVDGVTVDDDDGGQYSNMYDRTKAQPRMCFKRHSIRTPFAGYGKKRKPKLLTMG